MSPRRLLLAVAVLATAAVAVFLIIDEDDNTVTVTPDAYPGEWPLTVDSVELSCELTGDRIKRPAVLVTTPDGETYALNGAAQAATTYVAADPIRREAAGGGLVPPGELIRMGVALCDD